MCKRRSPTDPLVRRFLQSYGVNLLPLPRRGAEPGELYVQTGRKVKVHSKAGELLVEWPEDGRLKLTSTAKIVAEGKYFED